ncbi:hypothetical protein EDD21DRAFT_430910, partial [Dissophora ornata]
GHGFPCSVVATFSEFAAGNSLWHPPTGDISVAAGEAETANNAADTMSSHNVAMHMRCRSGDIVISKDSDTLVYKSISTIWRPISRKRLIVYEIPDVLAALGISRTRLTVLGIVSRNDCNCNIPSLGSETNVSVVTTSDEADLRSMVQKHLVHEQVLLKNIKQETFDTSLKVFVLCVQTPVLEPLTLPSAQESLTYGSLQRDFKHLQEQAAEKKREQKQLQNSKKERGDRISGIKKGLAEPHKSVEIPGIFGLVGLLKRPGHQTSFPFTGLGNNICFVRPHFSP